MNDDLGARRRRVEEDGAAARVERLGPVVAAFDNEPAHVNLYARRWPAALVVHVDTDRFRSPDRGAAGCPLHRGLPRPFGLSDAAGSATAGAP